MKRFALVIALAGALSAIASAQVAVPTPQPVPYYIVVTPPYPGTAIAGPFPDYTSCARSISAYQGTDYSHQYGCQIRY